MSLQEYSTGWQWHMFHKSSCFICLHAYVFQKADYVLFSFLCILFITRFLYSSLLLSFDHLKIASPFYLNNLFLLGFVCNYFVICGCDPRLTGTDLTCYCVLHWRQSHAVVVQGHAHLIQIYYSIERDKTQLKSHFCCSMNESHPKTIVNENISQFW